MDKGTDGNKLAGGAQGSGITPIDEGAFAK
jgi:hypothetical protein